MPDPIVVKVLSDTRSLVRGMRSAKGEVGGFGRFASKALKGVAIAGGIAGVALVKLGIDAAKSASEDAQAQTRLATVLKNATGARSKDVAGIERYITAQGKAFGVTDDDLRPAISRLAAATGSLTKARKLTTLSENVAAGTGKGLASVTSALAKAQLGSTAGLAKLGVKTKNQAGEALSLKQITEDLARTYRGSAAKAADTLSGKFAISKLRMQEAKEEAGTALMPILTDLADLVTDKLVPAIEDGADWLKRNQGQIKATAAEVKDTFLPPLKDLVGIAKDVVTFVGGIPEPVRKVGAEAAAAAFILPKLNGALLTVKGTMIGTAATADTTTKRLTALKSAAKGAGGVGGMLLLAHGAQESNQQLGLLEGAAGGALLGFAVGGPIGAAIGTAGGALGVLAAQAKRAGDAAELSGPQWGAYADTIDGVTGALTKATRASVVHALAESDAFTTAAKLGISKRTLIDASLGEIDAMVKLDRARQTERATIAQLVAQKARGGNTIDLQLLQQEIDDRRRNLDLINQTIGTSAETRRATREQIRLSTDWGDVLKGLPKRLITTVETQGLTPTLKGVARLTERYNLTPKQIKTLLTVSEVDKTIRDVRRVQAELKSTKDAKPDLTQFQRGVQLGGEAGVGEARRQGVAMADVLKRETGKARPNLKPFTQFFHSGLNPVKTDATLGGIAIGGNLKSGVLQGFRGTASELSAQAVAAVRAAIVAARAEGDIHSPSRKTFIIGAALGRGMVDGLKSESRPLVQTVRDMVRLIRDGFVESTAGPGASAVETALQEINDAVRKATEKQHDLKVKAYEKDVAARRRALNKEFDGKELRERLAALEKEHDRHLAALERKYDRLAKLRVKGLADEKRAVRDAAAAYDAAAASLESWTQTLADRRGALSDHIAQIRDMVQAYGDVTALGQRAQGEGTVITATGIIEDLNARLAKVKAFIQKIAELTAGGLNQTTLQQLLAAGVDTGLASAEAIAAGGAGAISEINSLTAQLAAAGAQLGADTGATFYGEGIAAAEQMVRGLNRQVAIDQVNVENAMIKLGQAAADGLKSGLKSQNGELRQAIRELAGDMEAELREAWGLPGNRNRGNPAGQLTGGHSGSGSGPLVTVKLTAEQQTSVQRGKAILIDIDAAQSVGARRTP